MNQSNVLRTGRHCIFLLHVHLVFVTKYRKKIFNRQMLAQMKEIFGDVAKDFECELLEFEGECDHVHLLLNFPPKVAISKLVNSLKGVSSRYLRRDYPQLHQLCKKKALWSPSYFAGSCGGAPLETIKKYIESQAKPAN